MQTERWVATNPQTKPTNLGCESAERLAATIRRHHRQIVWSGFLWWKQKTFSVLVATLALPDWQLWACFLTDEYYSVVLLSFTWLHMKYIKFLSFTVMLGCIWRLAGSLLLWVLDQIPYPVLQYSSITAAAFTLNKICSKYWVEEIGVQLSWQLVVVKPTCWLAVCCLQVCQTNKNVR